MKKRLVVAALCALAVLLLWALFPQGDGREDLAFQAQGRVASLVEVEGRVVGLVLAPEHGEAYTVALSSACRVVASGGKVPAHQLAGKFVKLHFVAPEGEESENVSSVLNADLPLTGDSAPGGDLVPDGDLVLDGMLVADVIFVEG